MGLASCEHRRHNHGGSRTRTSIRAAPRIQSVGALRGAIMILMAIDHIRDFVARSAMQFLRTDLTRTTAPVFFRWITHFCAPVFMLTAGLGAFFWMARGHRSKSEHHVSTWFGLINWPTILGTFRKESSTWQP